MNPIRLVKFWTPLFVASVAGVLLFGQSGNPVNFQADLNGYREAPPVSTAATGEFRATLNSSGTEIAYELVYSRLSTPVLFAHIHFGQPGVNGGVMTFLCGGGNSPACPPGNGTAEAKVTGVLRAASVVGPAGQGIPAGDFAKAIAAIRTGAAYVNVHSSNFPGGEIRGQVRRGGGKDDDDDDDDDDRGRGRGKGKQ